MNDRPSGSKMVDLPKGVGRTETQSCVWTSRVETQAYSPKGGEHGSPYGASYSPKGGENGCAKTSRIEVPRLLTVTLPKGGRIDRVTHQGVEN